MNGLYSLLSNDLQRGYEAGLASLVPPRRMADGGFNPADTGRYKYKFNRDTGTFELVQTPEEYLESLKGGIKEDSLIEGDTGGDYTSPTTTPSGKGVVADLQDFGQGVSKGLQGLAGFIGKGGLLGIAAKGIAQALGIPGFGGQQAAPTGMTTSDMAIALGGYGAGIDPEAGGMGESVGPSVGVGGLGDVDTSFGGGEEGISVIAKGGVVRAAKGMSMEDNSFILPADVVAAMGNGSSQAGLQALRNNMGPGVQMIRGAGDGMSDSIPANIAGTQPALISDGEAYVPPGVVRAMGGGDMSKGAKNLYAMMDEARKQAYGRTQQANQIDPNKVMTKAMKG